MTAAMASTAAAPRAAAIRPVAPSSRAQRCNFEILSSRSLRLRKLVPMAVEKDEAKNPVAKNSIVCKECEGNGALLCTQCKGSGVNSEDFFDGRYKAGGLCWLCRGKREILCGNCNGAGFMGGFLSTFDETAM